MRGYAQYCPIAKASEILGDRWTLLIVREMLGGASGFNELQRGLPGISRSVLTERLRSLERAEVVERRTGPKGRTLEYRLTTAGRGANHPVLERRSGRVLVTSQNHGFAVAPSDDVEATHVSLYDGTVEGFEFPDLRARSVQFHPEAGPGPHDAWPILEAWVDELATGVPA
jgi:DNA-binding HxlR family transcriptional regulator